MQDRGLESGVPAAAESPTKFDVFGAAATLYRTITGKLPYATQKLKNVREAFNRPPDPPMAPEGQPEIPATLQTVLLKALEVDRELRTPTAQQFANELRHARAAAARDGQIASEQPCTCLMVGAPKLDGPSLQNDHQGTKP